VIVCPGGGYALRADHEGESVAHWLNRIGLAAFVLSYRVGPHRHPAPLHDALRAIRLVRHRSAGWNIDSSRIAILGFSAGGHLAATAATSWDHGTSEADDEIERLSSRPDALVLGYPVISFGASAHFGSMHNLLGPDPTPELRLRLSAETRVTAQTPPTFLWHTADDAGVSVEHSLLFATALARHGIPFGLHIYPYGAHGLGLAEHDPELHTWTLHCARFLADQDMGNGSVVR
jgi:acetyl esterase/lipase